MKRTHTVCKSNTKNQGTKPHSTTNPGFIALNSLQREVQTTPNLKAKAPKNINFLELPPDTCRLIFRHMTENGSTLLYASASKECYAAVQDFLLQLLLIYKNLDTSLCPFNNLNDFFLKDNTNPPVILYIHSVNNLFKYKVDVKVYNDLAMFINEFNRIIINYIEEWADSIFECNTEDNQYSITLRNEVRHTFDFSTIGSRFIAIKFINAYISSKVIFRNFSNSECNKKVIIKLIKFAKKHQPNECYHRVITTLICNAYNEFKSNNETSPLSIIHSTSKWLLFNTIHFDLIKALLITILKDNQANWEDYYYAIDAFNNVYAENDIKLDDAYFNDLIPLTLSVLNKENTHKLSLTTKLEIIYIIKRHIFDHKNIIKFGTDLYVTLKTITIELILESWTKHDIKFNAELIKSIIENKLSILNDKELGLLKNCLFQGLSNINDNNLSIEGLQLIKFFIETKLFIFNYHEQALLNNAKNELIRIITKLKLKKNEMHSIIETTIFLIKNNLIEINYLDFYNIIIKTLLAPTNENEKDYDFNSILFLHKLIEEELIKITPSMGHDLVKLLIDAIKSKDPSCNPYASLNLIRTFIEKEFQVTDWALFKSDIIEILKNNENLSFKAITKDILRLLKEKNKIELDESENELTLSEDEI